MRLALWAGKAAMAASRTLGRGGTAWPGRLAAAIDPGMLRRAASSLGQGSVLVTGTNGKTTTALLLRSIASRRGLRLVHNLAGANLPHGVLAAFIESAGWVGLPARDLAILEVDEGAFPAVAAAVQPVAVIVTNFFRDQLDRYGEVDGTVRRVAEGIGAAGARARWFVCADDPLSAWLGEQVRQAGRPVTYFGLDEVVEDDLAAVPLLSADGIQCIDCGVPYRYERLFYAQLGHYACSRCGRRRPAPQVRGQALGLVGVGEAVHAGLEVDLEAPPHRLRLEVPLPGVHNAYNAMAAAAVGLSLGFAPEDVAQGIAGASVPFGRSERVHVNGRDVTLSLVKNPTSFNQVLATLAGRRPWRAVVMALNDLTADGRDVSWIWDVDFERFLAGRGSGWGPGVWCTGRRAEEMAVRLKYAGLPPARLVTEPHLGRALRHAIGQAAPGEPVLVLATYTAMLAARRVLVHSGLPRPAR